MELIALLISFAVGALTVYMMYACCAGKRQHNPQSAGNPTHSTSSSSQKSPKKDKTKPLSEKAYHIRIMLGLPERDCSVCIAVNMDKIYDECYQGMHEVVGALAEFATIYLLIKSTTDKEEEHQTKQILSHLNGIDIPAHHVLHHSSSVGKIAFLRQIKPNLHIEYEDDIYKATKVHIPLIVFHRCDDVVSSPEKTHYHKINNYHELSKVEVCL